MGRLLLLLSGASALLVAAATACGGGEGPNESGGHLRPGEKVSVDFSGLPQAATFQSDGKVLVVGTFPGYFETARYLEIARYLPDGRLDRGFGTAGHIRTVFSEKHKTSASTLVVQPDGSIIVAGAVIYPKHLRRIDVGHRTEVFPLSDTLVTRYTPDGKLDTSFGNGGRVVTDLGPFDSISHVGLQRDGKIVAYGGDIGLGVLLRYTAQGRLDPTFGSGGKTLIPAQDDLDVGEIAVQRNGKIVLAGTGSCCGGAGVFGLTRYTPKGVVDLAFGKGGAVLTEIGSESNAVDMTLQADGKIVASGYGYGSMFALARYKEDGSLDESFGRGSETAGTVVTRLGPDTSIATADVVAVQPDGKIVAAGDYSDEHLRYSCAVARYEIDGRLDRSFGRAGKVKTALPAREVVCSPLALTVRKDGSIVVAWKEGNGLVLRRYAAQNGTP